MGDVRCRTPSIKSLPFVQDFYLSKHDRRFPKREQSQSDFRLLTSSVNARDDSSQSLILSGCDDYIFFR